MSQISTSEGASLELGKPAQSQASVNVIPFPPFPEPSDFDFDEDISEEERNFYKHQFSDLNKVSNCRLHCTACDRHLGCSSSNEAKMKVHPMLRTLMCQPCHSFYNSGEFDKGDDGSELYCRWCGQGGQVYCCSDCPVVFCAKCIKRNFGMSKIKEIENTDDWKCFKCNSKCLWDLRAICWALLRFCDLKNKLIHQTEDSALKQKYEEAYSTDLSTCCKSRIRKKDVNLKKKEVENVAKKIISKIPPTIQVKKFASITETEKKVNKRPASPKIKPIKSITGSASVGYHQVKKIKLFPAGVPQGVLRPISFRADNPVRPIQYGRSVARLRQPLPIMSTFNGFNSTGLYSQMNQVPNDNINLSLENLTQGLDMSAVSSIENDETLDANVVCTPDFPMEPLCEVTEENDDDVQCMTPAPSTPRINTNNPPPLLPRNQLSDNIVQMTENDVTVNAVTGGLKFRVDPQTLSANKMYRLPDGRVFAINPNPNMPGGYSATIVSVSDTTGKVAPRGETFAAKLSTVSRSSTPRNQKNNKALRSNNVPTPVRNSKRKPTQKPKNVDVSKAKERRECDMKVPVEWYRYNLIDAIDALEYSLARLEQLKKEATTVHLRTRTADEMKILHKTLENHLATSTKRFYEIRENLNRELKNYLAKKINKPDESSGEDDDVLILPNDNDDPISIDENSMDSINGIESQEVDLTEGGSEQSSFEKTDVDPVRNLDDNNDKASSIHNDSNKDDTFKDVLVTNVTTTTKESDEIENVNTKENDKIENGVEEQSENSATVTELNDSDNKSNENDYVTVETNDTTESHGTGEENDESVNEGKNDDITQKDTDKNDDTTDAEEELITGDIVHERQDAENNDTAIVPENKDDKTEKDKVSDTNVDSTVEDRTEPQKNETEASNEPDGAMPDPDMSEDMIENLLKDYRWD